MASQKLTVPVVTGEPLRVTLAVSVTAFPRLIDVTGLPAEVRVSAVKVADGAGSVNVAVATADGEYPDSTAIASIVSVAPAVNVPV